MEEKRAQAKIGSKEFQYTGQDNLFKSVNDQPLKSVRINQLFNDIANNSEVLRLLKEDPTEIGRRYSLNKNEMKALLSADLLLVKQPHHPLLKIFKNTLTFETGSTITASIQDLSKEEIIEVLKHAINDDEYAKKLKDFFRE
ncbi:hypothetical protein ABEW83_15160 [Bacillus subtilis]